MISHLSMSKKRTLLTTCLGVALVSDAGAIKIGFGTALNGVQDTPAGNSGANQMRQNINITDTVFLPAGTYHATTWEYLAGPDSTVPGVTQPVFPFLTIVNGPGNHTVVAFGETIDTDPGEQTGVAFGGDNHTFTIPAGGATVAAGIQNPSAPGVQNSILTDTSFGQTDHANSGNFDDAASVGATLDSRSFGGLPRTYAFAIEVVEEGEIADGDGDGLPATWEEANALDDSDDGSAGESTAGAKDGPNGALGDPDDDGLDNAGEFERGTDPQEKDSDGDTVSDGQEVAEGTNPNKKDSDDDGLDDGVEASLGSDPLDPDTDNDGRSDGEEFALGSDLNDPNSPGWVRIGFGPELVGVVDTASDGFSNQMRQNINITDTVFLEAGTYRAIAWDYNAAPDATNGATQPVFPFLTIVNGPANHTVLAVGETIDTEPGIQLGVPFGGEEDVFTIPEGGATVAAGIQNPSGAGVTNSIYTDTSFGVTDHANSFNFDEAVPGADLVSFGHGNLTRTYAFSIDVGRGSGEEPLKLAIDRDGGDLVLEWESKPGMFYNLKTSTDLAADPATWDPVEVDGVFDIPSTPSLNVHSIARPADPERYYRVEEYALPPVSLFFEDFDGGDPGWTTGFDLADAQKLTAWERGDPAGGAATGPSAARSGTNCYGTNIGSDYGAESNTWLRTPVMDLTAATGATVSFHQWVDIDEFEDAGGVGDRGSLRVLAADTLTELAVLEARVVGFANDWEQYSVDLPATALGQEVVLEFVFVSDPDESVIASGWYIDDVQVTIPAP
ncbi:MAG: hypothetical protein CMP28_05860 [Roseibacillus sp.]|nr:hypothetical protein [Roseibacillus sp.]